MTFDYPSILEKIYQGWYQVVPLSQGKIYPDDALQKNFHQLYTAAKSECVDGLALIGHEDIVVPLDFTTLDTPLRVADVLATLPPEASLAVKRRRDDRDNKSTQKEPNPTEVAHIPPNPQVQHIRINQEISINQKIHTNPQTLSGVMGDSQSISLFNLDTKQILSNKPLDKHEDRKQVVVVAEPQIPAAVAHRALNATELQEIAALVKKTKLRSKPESQDDINTFNIARRELTSLNRGMPGFSDSPKEERDSDYLEIFHPPFVDAWVDASASFLPDNFSRDDFEDAVFRVLGYTKSGYCDGLITMWQEAQQCNPPAVVKARYLRSPIYWTVASFMRLLQINAGEGKPFAMGTRMLCEIAGRDVENYSTSNNWLTGLKRKQFVFPDGRRGAVIELVTRGTKELIDVSIPGTTKTQRKRRASTWRYLLPLDEEQ